MLIIALIIIVAGAAWWYLNKANLRITLDKAQILQHLTQKIPATQTYLYIFQVSFDAPRVDLDETSQRINAGLDISVQITLLNDPEPLRGRIDTSTGIRYDSNRGEFYLTDPQITHLQLDGVPDQWAEKALSVVEQGLDSYFESQPIYTLTDRQSHRFAKAVLHSVSIETDRVVLHLGAPK